MSALTPVTESLTELHRRADITSKARYHAARRMGIHSVLSQWTLAFLAVGQIVISIVVALKLKTNFNPSYVDFGAIFFGVQVLAYSLLLGMSNYSVRSVQLHQCGMELGGLARRLFLLSRDSSSTNAIYDQAASEYYSILSRYENHSAVDYLVAHHEHFQSKLSDLQRLSFEWFSEHIRLLYVRLRFNFLHILQFSHYVISATLMAIWIYYLVIPKHG